METPTKRKKSKQNKVLETLSEKKRKPRGEGNDAKRVMERIGNWDYKNSDVYRTINDHFHSGITQPELLKIGEILARFMGLTIDRDARRDSRVLYRWFYENWGVLRPEVLNITMYDAENQLISKPSQRQPIQPQPDQPLIDQPQLDLSQSDLLQ